MSNDSKLRSLRDELRRFISRNCKIAICVADGDKILGPAALKLLSNALRHPELKNRKHQIFFDEGLFSSSQAAETIAQKDDSFAECEFFFEQDSRKVKGIQLADIAAHFCSTLLAEKLGHISKRVVLDIPGDEIYDGNEVSLGFELWASDEMRRAFLSL